MAGVERRRYSTTIAAPVGVVWDTMLGEQTYRLWTRAFDEGSRYEGSWSEGSRIHFLSSTGDGMVAEIAESRPNAFVSIRHLGMISGGVEDTESEAVRRWAPAYENYSFTPVDGGTRLDVELDVAPEYEELMDQAWPRALARLKELCEGGA
ncbi:MAG: SRPBCC domain-containing protein [Acidobacteria bacterium]|nr:MAG: SRPBCC domain-containing protein [Acidobacteriota bacterium]REK03237.1 MAG: SRPBCC domain-containing protein [Acidobacteriota bacterium]